MIRTSSYLIKLNIFDKNIIYDARQLLRNQKTLIKTKFPKFPNLHFCQKNLKSHETSLNQSEQADTFPNQIVLIKKTKIYNALELFRRSRSYRNTFQIFFQTLSYFHRFLPTTDFGHTEPSLNSKDPILNTNGWVPGKLMNMRVHFFCFFPELNL